MKLNAGEIVEHAVRRQNVNISELSRRMKVNRRTLYNWFQQKSLNADVICGIGEVINYDFSKDFNEELESNKLKSKERILNPKINKDYNAQESVYYWMEKYISLLEDYKKLLQNSSSYDNNFDSVRRKQNEC
jgi:transcriptional regulator with XRE-family HTH domain